MCCHDSNSGISPPHKHFRPWPQELFAERESAVDQTLITSWLLARSVCVCLFGWLARPVRRGVAVVRSRVFMYYACAVGPTTYNSRCCAVLWCCERNSIVRFMDAPAYLLAEAVHLSNRRRRPTGSPLTVQQFNFLTSQPYALLDVITAPSPPFCVSVSVV